MKIFISFKKTDYCKHTLPVTKEAYEDMRGKKCPKCHKPYKPWTSWWMDLLGIEDIE